MYEHEYEQRQHVLMFHLMLHVHANIYTSPANYDLMTALNLGIQESGNPEIWDPQTTNNYKLSTSTSVSPKMSARSELVGKKQLLAPFGTISGNFFMGQKHAENKAIFLGGPMGPYSPSLGSSSYIWQGVVGNGSCWIV